MRDKDVYQSGNIRDGTDSENTLKGIIKKKLEDTQNAEGIISIECWRTEEMNIIGYCLVMKWDTEASFKEWMRNSHAGKRNGAENGQARPAIKKKGLQFESVDTVLLLAPSK